MPKTLPIFQELLLIYENSNHFASFFRLNHFFMFGYGANLFFMLKTFNASEVQSKVKKYVPQKPNPPFPSKKKGAKRENQISGKRKRDDECRVATKAQQKTLYFNLCKKVSERTAKD